jgi:hypothetical protein
VLAISEATCRSDFIDINKCFGNAVGIGNKPDCSDAGGVNENATAGEQMKFSCCCCVSAFAVALTNIANRDDVIAE